MSKLGLRSARKLTLAGIKISLIELQSCEFRQKLALPELKKAELRTTLYEESCHDNNALKTGNAPQARNLCLAPKTPVHPGIGPNSGWPHEIMRRNCDLDTFLAH